jgi:ribosome recycling factor
MKNKLKKRESKKSTKIDSVYSFYNDVQKLHAQVRG